MVKKMLIGFAILLVLLFAFFTWFKTYTKSHSPKEQALLKKGELTATVVYCRPYKKGRVIFGDADSGALQPYGKYWRAGANEATTIAFSKDVLFNGLPVKAGTYALYVIPDKQEWTVGLNSDYDRWGAREVEHEKDILQTKVVVDTEAPEQEQLSISFSEADSTGMAYLKLHWDTYQVAIPIQ